MAGAMRCEDLCLELNGVRYFAKLIVNGERRMRMKLLLCGDTLVHDRVFLPGEEQRMKQTAESMMRTRLG